MVALMSSQLGVLPCMYVELMYVSWKAALVLLGQTHSPSLLTLQFSSHTRPHYLPTVTVTKDQLNCFLHICVKHDEPA